MIGIVGYGGYIPRFRIKVEEIASVWETDPRIIKKGLLVLPLTVPAGEVTGRYGGVSV